MVFKKCVKCKKNITKKNPAVECSRCSKILHADNVCSKLTNKQITAIRSSPGIEWCCDDCLKNTSRRSSFLIPEDEGDEDESETEFIVSPQTIDTNKLAQDISREIKKTFKEELRNLETSLEFLSEQISSMEQTVKNQDSKIKDLEHKNNDLLNRNKNLNLRVAALEQGLHQLEQKNLSSSIEINGIPEIPIKDINKIIGEIGSKLDLDKQDIRSVQRLPGSKTKPGVILLEMKSREAQEKWINSGKEKCPTVGSLLPEVSKENATQRVYIREALTKHTKTLLFNAKNLLSKSFQYVWYKNGKVCVRKSGNSKIYYIRSIDDINELIKIA